MHATSPLQVKLHVATKNVQSMRAEVRFQDCLSELDAGDHDLIFVSEIWRSDVLEVFEIGIYISPMISDICFHAISARLCMVQLTCHGRKFHVYLCYFPTSWDHDDRVGELYSILDVMLLQTRASAAIPILGGNFNACIGAALPQDDVALLGSWGLGARNDRGSSLARWVLEHQFHIVSRFAARTPVPHS